MTKVRQERKEKNKMMMEGKIDEIREKRETKRGKEKGIENGGGKRKKRREKEKRER